MTWILGGALLIVLLMLAVGSYLVTFDEWIATPSEETPRERLFRELNRQ